MWSCVQRKMLLCVLWYVAYALSLRNLEEMMAERAIGVDHSTVHRWVIKLVPLFEKTFRKHKRPVGKSWRMDETYIKVKRLVEVPLSVDGRGGQHH